MNDKVKKYSEFISVSLSIIAIIISIISFGYTVQKDNSDNQEIISISNSEFGYNDMLNYNMSGGFRGKGIVDGINYSIIISNNSKQRVSLISYNIFQRTENMRFQYKDMVKEIKDISNQKILFPLSLDAGEAVSLTFEINTLIPSDVNMLLLDKYGVSGKIPSQDIITYLGENNCDLFGNEVKYTPFGDGSYHIEIDTPSFPAYDLQINTSKGTVVQTILTH